MSEKFNIHSEKDHNYTNHFNQICVRFIFWYFSSVTKLRFWSLFFYEGASSGEMMVYNADRSVEGYVYHTERGS